MCAFRPNSTREVCALDFQKRHACVYPSPLGSARREEADEVRHIAPADQQSAAIDGIANELCDPSHGLALDLGSGWRECPCANVRVQRGREKVPENPDRRWRGGNVSKEARVSVE